MYKNYESQIQGWEIELAEKKARRFQKQCERMGVPVGQEDVCGLVLNCIERYIAVKDKFDPIINPSKEIFMGRIIRRELQDFLREMKVQKRGAFYHKVPLDEPVRHSDGDFLTLVEIIPGTNDRFINRFSNEDLKIDLSKALQKLTQMQKELCDLLKRGLNITEISKYLQIPRPTLYDEIKRIRKVFISEGLKDYLSNF